MYLYRHINTSSSMSICIYITKCTFKISHMCSHIHTYVYFYAICSYSKPLFTHVNATVYWHIYTHLYIWQQSYMYTYMYLYKLTCMYKYELKFIDVYILMYTYIYIYIFHMIKHVHTYICNHLQMNINICIYR